MVKQLIWRICCIIVLSILVLTYSPLVLKPHTVDPWLFGLPFTLWSTLASAFSIVLVTAIAAFFRPDQGASD